MNAKDTELPVDAEGHTLDMKQQVQLAREKLAQARRDRQANRVYIPGSVPQPQRDAQLSMWDPFI